MAKDEKQFCWGCMTLQEDTGRCPHCGFDNSAPTSGEFLRPGSSLAKRYVVGKLISHNGEGALYLGYDKEEERKVWIAEYAPDTLCRRNEETGNVAPRIGREAQYKSLMYDFIENAQILRGMHLGGAGGIVPVLDMIGYYGTAYTIYRYIEAVPLLEYLKEAGGEVAWPKAKQMFIPLCKSLRALHEQGAIHRGVAPDSLFVDIKGRLWLRGMAVSAARTGMSELCCELFEGYSAPEQYSATGKQGAWTDVYSCAAVLYRMLTGTMPTAAELRKEKDTLYPANMVNSSVPADVSAAIDGAMLVNVERRTAGMDALIAELLEELASNTAVFDSNALPAAQGSGARYAGMSGGGRRGKPMPFWLRTMLTTCIVLGAVVALLCTTVLRPLLFPEPSSSSESAQESVSSEESVPVELVPDFLNRYERSVTQNSMYTGKYTFTVVEEFNEDVPEGVIVSQSPSSGAEIPEDGVVTLTVSRGSQIATMPYLIGSTLDLAKHTLDDLGIRYQVLTQKGIDGEPGLVLKTSLPAGSEVVRERDVVYLTVKEEEPTVIGNVTITTTDESVTGGAEESSVSSNSEEG